MGRYRERRRSPGLRSGGPDSTERLVVPKRSKVSCLPLSGRTTATTIVPVTAYER